MKKRLIDPSEIEYPQCIQNARDDHEVAIRENAGILNWHDQKPFAREMGLMESKERE